MSFLYDFLYCAGVIAYFFLKHRMKYVGVTPQISLISPIERSVVSSKYLPNLIFSACNFSEKALAHRITEIKAEHSVGRLSFALEKLAPFMR